MVTNRANPPYGWVPTSESSRAIHKATNHKLGAYGAPKARLRRTAIKNVFRRGITWRTKVVSLLVGLARTCHTTPLPRLEEGASG